MYNNEDTLLGDDTIDAQWTLPVGTPPPAARSENRSEHENYDDRGDPYKHDNEAPTTTNAEYENSIASLHTSRKKTTGEFYSILDKQRYTVTKPDIVEKELLWQQAGMGGNKTAQSEFKEEMLAQRTLRTFAIMCKNSPYLTICHSLAKFYSSPGEESKGLHGKCIAFVGDREESRDPQMVILPDNAWDWISPTVYADYEALEDFYDPQKGNATKLFPPLARPALATTTRQGTKKAKPKGDLKRTGDDKETDGEIKGNAFEQFDIPQMLYLPTYIFGEIFHKQYWTPADFLEIILAAQEEYDMQIDQGVWNMMKHWAVAAMQLVTTGGKSSPVAITVEALTQADKAFLDWCKFRIDTTFGARGPMQNQQQQKQAKPQ
jgi:hypothetical protein